MDKLSKKDAETLVNIVDSFTITYWTWMLNKYIEAKNKENSNGQ